MDKTKALKTIANQIEVCRICRQNKIGLAVPGEGNADADIVFIGEAPGKTEAKTGRPFVGRSGKLLRKLIAEAGLLENDVYITSPVKYLPVHITPTPAEIAHGRIHLMKQLAIIDPQVVVLLGKTAVKGVLEMDTAILKEHGNLIEKDGKKYFFTLHPAAALRFAKFMQPLKEDFQKLKKIIA